jgi:hypothetical protein
MTDTETEEEISLEERVDALSSYMNECQDRILELESCMKVFADCLKDMMLALPLENVRSMMMQGQRDEPVKDEILDLVYSQNREREELKAPRASSGWIRVSDALPEMGEPVLVVEKRADGSCFLARRESVGDGWAWMTQFKVRSHEYVSHWLPIPELPEE